MEALGTFVLILLGCGVVAGVSLTKSKGAGGGWVVVTLAWGLAVMCGVLIAGPYTGAHLNPAVSIGLAAAGAFPWGSVLPYIIAQMVGAIIGGLCVWVFYKDHFDVTEDKDAKLGVFCTIPAIRNYRRNLVCEIIATFVLVLVILFMADPPNAPHIKEGMAATDVPKQLIGLGSIGAIPVAFLIVVIGMSLGGTTGYAINPARDLGPRIAHVIAPIKDKRDPDWNYSWVPIIGPIIGGVTAALVFVGIKALIA